MARRDSEFAVRTEGLGKLNRDLGRISKGLRKESLDHFRSVARDVRGKAQARAPRLTGELAGSLRYSVTNRGASVYSNLPQSPIHEYGGTISPRGVPIQIQRSRFVGSAVQEETARIEEHVGDLLDRIARSNGFR